MGVILFDLEGTLVQSIENDHGALHDFRGRTREKLLELGIPPKALGNLTKSTLIRNRAREYVEERFSVKKAELFRVEMDRFLKSYELCWADHSKIFPDTLPALHKLKNLRFKMGIVTNTSEEAATRMLLIHGIKGFFDVVVTREDVKRLKPDPEGILVALKRLVARDFFFVGDLVHDSLAARQADGISITVKRSLSKKLGFGSHYFVRSLLEIPRIVTHSASKQS